MIAEQAGSGNPHPNVRFWLLADIKLLRDLGLLSPRKRTFLEAAQKVRFWHKADINLRSEKLRYSYLITSTGHCSAASLIWSSKCDKSTPSITVFVPTTLKTSGHVPSARPQEIHPSSIQTRFIAIALSPSIVLTHFVPTFPKCPLKPGPMIVEDDASVKVETGSGWY